MSQSEVTELLKQIGGENDAASERLFSLIYNELRIIARSRMAVEKAGHTLQPTALVHEAFLRLTAGETIEWRNRRHFLGAAAEAMRRILIEHARAKNRQKRGGELKRVTLSEDIPQAVEEECDLIALSDALDELEEMDPAMAEIVKLRYFAGLTVEETADAVNCSARTVNRQWTAAKAWLRMSLDNLADMREGARI